MRPTLPMTPANGDEPPENLDTCLARYEAMLNACEAPEASRRKIYGETLAKILGIKVRA